MVTYMTDWNSVFAEFPTLETQRFTLRSVTLADTDAIFALMGDPQVNLYLGRAPLASHDQAAERVAVYQSTFTEQTGMVWAITPHGSDQLIGTCLLWRLRKEHFRAEIGYALVPAWWGQGVMSEVMRTVLTFAFTQMGLHSLEAVIDPANDASRRVLEKMGFVQEAYFREDFFHPVEQRFTDTAILSLLQSSWMSRPTT